MASSDISFYITERIDPDKTYAEAARDVQAGRSVTIHHHDIMEDCREGCVRKP